jgi:hypothetical protein
MTPRHGQRGITALGMLILAGLVGVLGLGALKVTPLYLQNLRLGAVMDDLAIELNGKGATPAAIRSELNKRLYIEGVRIPGEAVKIVQGRNGYQVQVQHEGRAPFMADIWLLVVFDKQISIAR